MKVSHVYLGRFSPFHLGHQAMVEKIVAEHGEENTLVVVGSSNAYNERTPYTFEERKKMIETLFPKIKIIPLPDGKPNLLYFDGSTNDIWLKSIVDLELKMKLKFVFYGGSVEDLEVLSHKFDTVVLMNRKNIYNGISATKVREALEKNNSESLEQLLDPRIIPLAMSGFENFKNITKK